MATTKTVRAGVLGFSGYSGAELVRLLRRHPQSIPVLLEHRATSEDERAPWEDGLERVSFTSAGLAAAPVDVVFTATSAEVALEAVPLALEAGAKAVDISGAHRLRTAETQKRWYGFDHPRPDLLAEASYGLPEFYREQIRGARLVANPGCYPTAANLSIEPLAAAEVLDRSFGIVCDAKSGVSGAGRKPSAKTHFSQVTENFSAYGALFHRHTPEVMQNSGLSEGELFFTAQLLPLHRGILETIYLRTVNPMTTDDVVAVLEARYADEPFVRVLPGGELPDLHSVQYTNLCKIGVRADAATRRVMLVSVIDNLIKGAAGQALQNMNLLFGLDETMGLLNAADGERP
ncbi:MAG: N-acetyl-gamma-glutamyl-phosphate reductase [Acidobacteria bacterium]|nr:N-acetyl-gamma-glutamyl-phosphate reductase [Acidobacteriota bacterium]